jgi:hypothetical protein
LHSIVNHYDVLKKRAPEENLMRLPATDEVNSREAPELTKPNHRHVDVRKVDIVGRYAADT